MKDYDSAIADFTRAIELDPKNADWYSYRGKAKFRKRDWDGAEADFAKAKELSPPSK